MVLTLHHLRKAQSERIIWLLHELEVPYKLVSHDRDPVSAASPPAAKDLHPAGTLPVLIDDAPPSGTRSPVVLGETGALFDYLLEVYGDHGKGQGSHLVRRPGDADFGEYLQWYAFGNGSLQPNISRMMTLRFGGVDPEGAIFKRFKTKFESLLQIVDDHLKTTGAFLVGKELTAADIMAVFSLTTMRGFYPQDLTKFTNILRYLKDVSELKTYKAAFEEGDPGLEPMISAKVEQFDFKGFPNPKI